MPIKHEGILTKNANGRWELKGSELTGGETLVIQIGGQWVQGRIEHDGRGYCFLAGTAKITLQDGTKARMPEPQE